MFQIRGHDRTRWRGGHGAFHATGGSRVRNCLESLRCNVGYFTVFFRKTLRAKTFPIILIFNGLLLWVLYQSAQKGGLLVDEESLRRYRPPPQAKVATVGRQMELEKEYWNPLLQDYIRINQERSAIDRLTKDDELDFVFVTGASSTFYSAALAAISAVQEHFPKSRIYFYDLEESSDQSDFIREKISLLCGVTYRQFEFSRYPPHVRNLRYYAWKPIIVYEMVKEFSGVLWMDSSIRFVSNNFTSILEKAVDNGGVVALTNTGHSNFAVTHQQMFTFLPSSMDGMIESIQLEANCVLFYRTRFVLFDVVWWWVLCALDPFCIAPIDDTSCDDPYKSKSIFANCHRFDQSAVNIILANHFEYDHLRYFGAIDVAKVHRVSGGGESVQVCAPRKNRTVADSWGYLKRTDRKVSPTLRVLRPLKKLEGDYRLLR